MLTCRECNQSLVRLPVSSEPEKIRQDAYCVTCGIRYEVTKAHLVKMNKKVHTKELNVRSNNSCYGCRFAEHICQCGYCNEVHCKILCENIWDGYVCDVFQERYGS